MSPSQSAGAYPGIEAIDTSSYDRM
ncbi:hypothetical protein EYZ11_009201 [Aspergillus tanneri]|uniref:Uncharacterized protein n=1 Tax=Aspergillus tanneri TaxID=1220188 RepID=A0A4S3J8M0_9EURO|nr:hypothetical protein EYZ11_009201 [Aspergillus tanneri]